MMPVKGRPFSEDCLLKTEYRRALCKKSCYASPEKGEWIEVIAWTLNPRSPVRLRGSQFILIEVSGDLNVSGVRSQETGPDQISQRAGTALHRD